MLDQRGQLLRAAVGFAGCSMPSYDRALHALRTWLDTWAGIGHVAVGMHRQGYDLQLTEYDERGWRATFYVTGVEHSPTRATGSAFEPTPWRAVRRCRVRRGAPCGRSDTGGADMRKIGAAAVILDVDGGVLLVKQTYGRLNWELPGGAAEAGESPDDTVLREVQEETGLAVAVLHMT